MHLSREIHPNCCTAPFRPALWPHLVWLVRSVQSAPRTYRRTPAVRPASQVRGRCPPYVRGCGYVHGYGYERGRCCGYGYGNGR